MGCCCVGSESTQELERIHVDSDACLLEVVGPDGDGKALVLAFRGTEPLELADFQSDFDAVPEEGAKGEKGNKESAEITDT
jgi:hypothetical protein